MKTKKAKKTKAASTSFAAARDRYRVLESRLQAQLAAAKGKLRATRKDLKLTLAAESDLREAIDHSRAQHEKALAAARDRAVAAEAEVSRLKVAEQQRMLVAHAAALEAEHGPAQASRPTGAPITVEPIVATSEQLTAAAQAAEVVEAAAPSAPPGALIVLTGKVIQLHGDGVVGSLLPPCEAVLIERGHPGGTAHTFLHFATEEAARAEFEASRARVHNADPLQMLHWLSFKIGALVTWDDGSDTKTDTVVSRVRQAQTAAVV